MWVNPFWFGFLLGMIVAMVIVTVIGKAISKQEAQDKEEKYQQFLQALEAGGMDVQAFVMEEREDGNSDTKPD